MNQWHKKLEQDISRVYPGVTIEWDGENPTLIIPNRLKRKAQEISENFAALYRCAGGEIEMGEPRETPA